MLRRSLVHVRRHSRESGNPFGFSRTLKMDSRFRGNDGVSKLKFVAVWKVFGMDEHER
jgi:hypothetical protein